MLPIHLNLRRLSGLFHSYFLNTFFMNDAFFWDVAPCSSCVNRRFGETQTAATCSRWFLARGFFYPEDGGDVSPKRRFTQELHGVTSQKTVAVRTSNLTNFFMTSDLLSCMLHFPPTSSSLIPSC
jgi:hypothetical protein